MVLALPQNARTTPVNRRLPHARGVRGDQEDQDSGLFNVVMSVVLGTSILVIDNDIVLGLVVLGGSAPCLVPAVFVMERYQPFTLGKSGAGRTHRPRHVHDRSHGRQRLRGGLPRSQRLPAQVVMCTIPGKVKLGMWSICNVSPWGFDLQLLAETAFSVLKQDSITH